MGTLKRLVLGDIHGHWNTLKQIYDLENPDEVIILGDYFDSFSGTTDSMTECFNNILALQKEHKENKAGDFILLLGNHDFHYLSQMERYSGYNWHYATWAEMKLRQAVEEKLIKVAHIDKVNKTIYSHAGVTNTWLRNSKLDDVDLEFINEVNQNCLCHKGNDPYGNDFTNGPLWVRPEALLCDIYEDNEGYTWTQIVGHTHIKNGPLFIKYDGTSCYGTKANNDYIGHRVPGRDNDLTIIYVMDTMPNYYMVEEVDIESEKVLVREVKNNTMNLLEE